MRVLALKRCAAFTDENSGSTCTVQYPLVVGEEYDVVGLGIVKGSHGAFSGMSFFIFNKRENLILRIPTELFEVVDSRPGLDWVTSYHLQHQDTNIGPELLIEDPFFLDDLTDGDPLARRRMQQIVQNL